MYIDLLLLLKHRIYNRHPRYPTLGGVLLDSTFVTVISYWTDIKFHMQ